MGDTAPASARQATGRPPDRAHLPRLSCIRNTSARTDTLGAAAVRSTVCTRPTRPSARGRPRSGSRPPHATLEVLREFFPPHPVTTPPHIDHEVAVPPTHYLPVVTEELPNPSARPVANHRSAYLAARGDPEAAHLILARKREQHEIPSHHLEPAGVDSLKVNAPEQLVQIAPGTFTRSGACAPSAGARREPDGPPACSSLRGTRGSSSDAGCSAGMYVSSSLLLTSPDLLRRGTSSLRLIPLRVNRRLC